MKSQKFIITDSSDVAEYLENYRCKKCGCKEVQILQNTDSEQVDMQIKCRNCGWTIKVSEF